MLPGQTQRYFLMGKLVLTSGRTGTGQGELGTAQMRLIEQEIQGPRYHRL